MAYSCSMMLQWETLYAHTSVSIFSFFYSARVIILPALDSSECLRRRTLEKAAHGGLVPSRLRAGSVTVSSLVMTGACLTNQ